MIRLLFFGGFLDSGKTTTILRLAREYVFAGKRVGIIANNLGEEEAGSQSNQFQGFPVEEVTGACFTCKFDALTVAVGRLRDRCHPDILLAEPAGSCTDIMGKVIEPLKRLYPGQLQVMPYVTVLDPNRTLRSLTGKGLRGFSTKVAYLYKMQQSEADIVAINKIDTLSHKELEELRDIVIQNFPKADVICISARTGEGFKKLSELLGLGQLSSSNLTIIDDFSQKLCKIAKTTAGNSC